ncbi:unnamed protein product [Protopolystoma xenopodis]|uniref:Uncharacterized protein n=1 Tax=Protopolystoma xenopodis TaxID=117903 RepID=A0A448XRL6_9PLAT|nr:unnamed protein product [Protopolystoma xenopodis]
MIYGCLSLPPTGPSTSDRSTSLFPLLKSTSQCGPHRAKTVTSLAHGPLAAAASTPGNEELDAVDGRDPVTGGGGLLLSDLVRASFGTSSSPASAPTAPDSQTIGIGSIGRSVVAGSASSVVVPASVGPVGCTASDVLPGPVGSSILS